MSLHLAAASAAGLSTLALMSVLISVPMLLEEINDIRRTLDTEMDEWRVSPLSFTMSNQLRMNESRDE